MRRGGSAHAALLLALLLVGCGSDLTAPQFSGPPVSVAVKFCTAASPVWVGYQNGTGSWVTVSRDAGTAQTYSFTINGGGGLAYVLPQGGDPASFGYTTDVVFATADELQKFVVGGCYAQPVGVKTIRGALAGLGANELGQIYLGGSTAGVASANGSDANFTLRRVADATLDLIAVRRTALANTSDIARMIVRRAINPADGSTLSPLDFNGSEAVQPVNATLTVTGSELGGLLSVTSSYATAGGSTVLFTGKQTSATSVGFLGVPASASAGDLHMLAVSTQDSFSEARSVESYFRAVGNRSLQLGPTLGPVTVTAVAGAPNVRLRVDVPSQSAYPSAAIAEISSGGFGPLSRKIELVMTAAYAGGTPQAWSITMPDLTVAPGYALRYGLTSALGLDYTAIATGGNRQFFMAAADGQSLSYALREGDTVVNGTSADALPLLARASRRSIPQGRPWSRRQP